MEPSVPGLPPLPWIVAPEDPPDTETVAEFPGEWEPQREVVFYGPIEPKWLVGNPVPRPSTLRLRRFHDVVLAPHHIILSYRDGRLLPVTYALRTYGGFLSPGTLDPFAPQFFNPKRCRAEPARMDVPCFLAQGGWDHFGHALLEMMPKLALKSAAPDCRHVVSSARQLGALFDMMKTGGEELAIFSGPLFCPTLYIPDPPVDLTGNFHRVARDGYAEIARFAAAGGIESGRRIFLSRTGAKIRRLVEEAEIETLFARYGFEIVHPEILPLAEQIRIIASAALIAGEGGSAMHNLVFAHAETKVLILNSNRWLAPIDRFIAKRDRQYGYVLGTAQERQGVHEREWPWTVDAGLVEHAIHEHFGL